MGKTLTLAAAAVSLCYLSALPEGIEATLDHVVIAVHDLDAAAKVYSALGFVVTPGGRHPGGTQNSIVSLSEGAYLELIAPYDVNLPGGKHMAERLERGEGALSAGLQVASAEGAVRDLTAAGLKVHSPRAGTILKSGETQAPTLWWTVGFEDEVAARPMFLIQYIRPVPPGTPHPNSAFVLSALLVCVGDIEKATAAYKAIGHVIDREIPMPEFGAAARQVALKGGSILLLRAADSAGPTARRLKEQGEGILGVRIGVTDLGQARKSVGKKNISTKELSVLVSPENASGMWLQFQSPEQ
jgi:catechol 2,3-dioxygenase-like lactoylglutathione lyase family enzyme